MFCTHVLWMEVVMFLFLSHQVEMVYSLLSMLGTHDKDDMSRTLFAMSSSQDSCIAMRQSGESHTRSLNIVKIRKLSIIKAYMGNRADRGNPSQVLTGIIPYLSSLNDKIKSIYYLVAYTISDFLYHMLSSINVLNCMPLSLQTWLM